MTGFCTYPEHTPRLIPFTEKLQPSEIIRDFRERYLLPELPGILAWAVQGCLDWQNGGLRDPIEVTAATAAYRQEMDAVATFLNQYYVLGNRTYTTKGADIYAKYAQWADTGREVVLSRRKFFNQLRERGCESFTGHGNALILRGIRQKTPDDAPPSDEGEQPRELVR